MYLQTVKESSSEVMQNSTIEIKLEAKSEKYCDDVQAKLSVDFIHSDGTIISGQGFPNGGKDWRVRFLPRKCGLYTWFTSSDDASLDKQQGSFVVKPGQTDNVFLNHGSIKISESKRYFEHEDGTPFLWIGEGLWAVAQQAEEDELDEYFKKRSQQNLSVVQYNTLLNWESTTPYKREPFRKVDNTPDLSLNNYEYFDFLDIVFDKCADNGMVSAAVVLWFNYLPGEKPDWYDPPFDWPVFTEDQAYQLGVFLGARYGSYPMVWLLSADIADYDPEAMSVLLSAVKGLQDGSFYEPIISSHIAAKTAFLPFLADYDWHAFHFIQSGHRKDSIGFPAAYCRAARNQTKAKPVVNGEMFFEGLGHTRENEKVSNDLIRRAAWESFLAGANAGVSYGAHGMWCWYDPKLDFRMHYLWQMPTPWKEAINFPGINYYKLLKDFFTDLPWYDYQEGTDIPIHEEGEEPATACRLGQGKYAVVYLPKARALRMTDLKFISAPAKWFDPIDGIYEPSTIIKEQGGVMVDPPNWEHDAVLLIGPLF